MAMTYTHSPDYSSIRGPAGRCLPWRNPWRYLHVAAYGRVTRVVCRRPRCGGATDACGVARCVSDA
eukprot:5782773-Prymnesium_polylepis.1